MDITQLARPGSEYAKNTPYPQQDNPEETKAGSEEQAAKNTPVPKSMPPGAQGGTSSATQNGTGQGSASVQQTSEASVAELLSSSSDEDDDSTYESIVRKADSGQQLTSSELSQLRSKDPARYSRAMQAAQARTELRQQMEANPSSANKAVKEAISAIQSQTDHTQLDNAHGDMSNLSPIVEALNNEYDNFSKKYDQVLFGN